MSKKEIEKGSRKGWFFRRRGAFYSSLVLLIIFLFFANRYHPSRDKYFSLKFENDKVIVCGLEKEDVETVN